MGRPATVASGRIGHEIQPEVSPRGAWTRRISLSQTRTPVADAGLPQEPLEPLVRRRLPSVERAALLRIDSRPARCVTSNCQPSSPAAALTAQSGFSSRIMLGQRDFEIVVERWSAWRAGDHVGAANSRCH